MKVKINKATYKIVEVENVVLDGDNCYWGVCKYEEQIIEIKKTLKDARKRHTLMHELTHAYLCEYALPQTDKTTYSYERVCDILATYADDIVKIADKYFKKTKKDSTKS